MTTPIDYDTLQTSVLEFITRSELTGNVEDWIALAEARLNRELPAVIEESTLTGVVDSRTIDVSSLSINEPMDLWLTDPSTSDEQRVTKSANFPYLSTSGTPEQYSYDSDDAELNFNRPCDVAYSFRFVYSERFALSDSVTTNWLLTNHPDVYLAACMAWGHIYTERLDAVQLIEAKLNMEMIPSVRSFIADLNRSQAKVDPALVLMNRYPRGWYDGDSL